MYAYIYMYMLFRPSWNQPGLLSKPLYFIECSSRNTVIGDELGLCLNITLYMILTRLAKAQTQKWTLPKRTLLKNIRKPGSGLNML